MHIYIHIYITNNILLSFTCLIYWYIYTYITNNTLLICILLIIHYITNILLISNVLVQYIYNILLSFTWRVRDKLWRGNTVLLIRSSSGVSVCTFVLVKQVNRVPDADGRISRLIAAIFFFLYFCTSKASKQST
jgi:hypothetical protein